MIHRQRCCDPDRPVIPRRGPTPWGRHLLPAASRHGHRPSGMIEKARLDPEITNAFRRFLQPGFRLHRAIAPEQSHLGSTSMHFWATAIASKLTESRPAPALSRAKGRSTPTPKPRPAIAQPDSPFIGPTPKAHDSAHASAYECGLLRSRGLLR